MKCPGIRTSAGKKGGPIHCNSNLQTIRTLANDRSVKRERRCPVCNAQYWTTEQFEDDILENKINQKNKYNTLESEYQNFIQDAGKIKQVLNAFKEMLDRA